MRPLKMNLTFLMEKCCEGHLNRHDIFLQTRDNVARHKANVTKRVTRVWNSGSFLYDLSKLIFYSEFDVGNAIECAPGSGFSTTGPLNIASWLIPNSRVHGHANELTLISFKFIR